MRIIPLAPKYQSGVYRITNRRNGRFYIGTTTLAMTERWKRHCYLLHAGIHHNKQLQADWDAYGARAFKFSVIEVVEDTSQAFIREQYWQRLKYNAKCYNPHPDDYAEFMKRRRGSGLSKDEKLFIYRVMRGSLPKTKENIRAAMELMGFSASDDVWEECWRLTS